MLRLYTGFVRGGPRDRFVQADIAEPSFDYYGRKISFNDLAEDKRRYIGKWPQRSLTVRSVTVKCEEPELHTCTVSGLLDWAVANSEKRLSGRSTTVLTVDMPLTLSKSLILLRFAPTLKGENGAVLAHGEGSVVAQRRITISARIPLSRRARRPTIRRSRLYASFPAILRTGAQMLAD